jgi:hypothetical protein
MTQSLEQAKATRNEAHRAFKLQIAQLQQDIAARGIGGRVVDRASEAVAGAAEVANENKGIVAGTITLLALWFMRHPIIRMVSKFRADDDPEDQTERTSENDQP